MVLFPLVVYWDRVNGYLSYEDFKAQYPGAVVRCTLYEGSVCSVSHYQAKPGLGFEKN